MISKMQNTTENGRASKRPAGMPSAGDQVRAAMAIAERIESLRINQTHTKSEAGDRSASFVGRAMNAVGAWGNERVQRSRLMRKAIRLSIAADEAGLDLRDITVRLDHSTLRPVLVRKKDVAARKSVPG